MRIGIDIGGSHIGIGLVNEQYKIVDKIERDWTNEEKKDLWHNIQSIIIELIHQLLKRNNVKQVESIGIGFPKSKIIDGIVYIEEEKIDLISLLEPIFNTNVYLKNDVKCSGICEKRIGNLKEYENSLFLTLGTGIGGAYFYKDELVVPNKYPGLEIGSMVIVKDGKQCKCGRKGCFEAYAAMKIFREKIQNLFGLEKVTSDVVLEIVNKKEKEQEVNNIINEYVEYLSLGLYNLIRILEPDAICIGGSFVHYERIFMKRLEKNLKEKFKGRPIPKILLAKYGNDAGIIGASMLQSN